MSAAGSGKQPFLFFVDLGLKTRHRRLFWSLLVALVALGTCAPRDQGPGRRTPPKASFKAGEVRAVDAADRAEASTRAMEEAGKVIDLLNSYYSVAFIDATRWRGGKHPELAGLFTDEAKPSVASNLDGLALGSLAPKLKALSPSRQEATKVSFEMEENLSSLYAIVTVAFEGTGTTQARKEGPVTIQHNAVFWLAKQADAWKIAAYQTQLKADTVSRGAAWPSSPGSPLAGDAR